MRSNGMGEPHVNVCRLGTQDTRKPRGVSINYGISRATVKVFATCPIRYPLYVCTIKAISSRSRISNYMNSINLCGNFSSRFLLIFCVSDVFGLLPQFCMEFYQ